MPFRPTKEQAVTSAPKQTKSVEPRDWSLHVEQLGRVSVADITVAPFVMLVGRNNTGKSYVASTVWALSQLYDLISGKNLERTLPTWYEEFSSVVSGTAGSAEIDIGYARSRSILSHLNKIIASEAGSFLSNSFKVDGFSRTKVNILPSALTSGLQVRVRRAEIEEGGQKSVNSDISILDDSRRELVTLTFNGADIRFYLRYIYCALATIVVFGGNQPTAQAMYIPAARTGLVLALKALAGQKNAFLSLESRNNVVLPAPIADFISRLGQPLRITPTRSARIADWLERAVLGGAVLRSETDAGLYYKPNDVDIQLPMYATSSMITELAPFLALVRNDWQQSQIIFEEPEAHLHIAAQREMARALARLLNAGCKIMITTHSDTFVQQVNNLMTIYSHPERQRLLEEYGYEMADLINPAVARAYEFVGGEAGTQVKPVELTEDGFVVASLNETLISLSDQTIQLQG